MVLLEPRSDHGRLYLLLFSSRAPKPLYVSLNGTSKTVDFLLPFLFYYYVVRVGRGVLCMCENVCAHMHARRVPRCTPGVSITIYSPCYLVTCSISTLRVILCFVCMCICASLARLVPKEVRKWCQISCSWSCR